MRELEPHETHTSIPMRTKMTQSVEHICSWLPLKLLLMASCAVLPPAYSASVFGSTPASPAPTSNAASDEHHGVLWSLGQFDGRPDEFPPSESAKRPLRLHAGVDKFDRVAWPWKAAGQITPLEHGAGVEVQFTVARAGVHTLEFALADAKPTPKAVVVWLDGKEVFREPVRGLGSSTDDCNLQYREHIPLELSAGEHQIGFGCVALGTVKAGNYVVLDALALLAGWQPLVYDVKAAEPEHWEAKDYSDPFESRWEARAFTVRVSGLAPGGYTLALNFQEDEVFKAGQRVFDVLLGGTKVLENVDVFAQAGGVFKPLKNTVPVEVGANGTLEFSLHTTQGMKALLNEFKLLRGDRVVLRHNCGFVAGTSRVFATPETLDGANKGGDLLLGEGEEEEEEEQPAIDAGGTRRFSGVNIVVNGDFEDALNESGLPAGWTSGETVTRKGKRMRLMPLKRNEYWKQGQGEATLDTAVKHGGKAALRLSHTKGLFGLSQGRYPNGWAEFDWTEPYELVAWVRAQDAAGENCLRIDWGSMVNHSQRHYLGAVNFPLPQGTYDWTEVRLPVQPPPGACSLSVAVTCQDNPGTLWVDDISVDGFGTRPVQILLSQAGYATRALKEAIVLTPTAHAAGTFALRPAKGGNAVASGPLEKLGLYQPYGRHVWRARFSDVTASGEYVLQADFPSGSTGISCAFPIRPDVLVNLARLNVAYFRIIQANVAIPGWHGADNLDDACVRNDRFNPHEPEAKSGPHLTALGNYYDAGDFSKKPMGALVAVALAELDALWKPEFQTFGYAPSDPIAIGLHGAKFFKDTQRPDGGFYASVLRDTKPTGDPAAMSDGIPGTEDDGVLVADREPGIPYALARFALLLKRRDPALAAEYARVAERGLTPVLRYWDDFGGSQAAAYKRLAFAPVAAGAAINLHQLLSDRADLKAEADRRLREIMQLVDTRAFDDKHYWLLTIATHNGRELCHEFGFAQAMLDFLEAYPQDPLAPEIRRSLTGFIEGALLPAMQDDPFGLLGEITADRKHARPYLSPRYYTTTIFAAGYILARAAQQLDRPDWLAPAERQLYWGLGFNPRGVSFCAGVGEKLAATRTHLSGVPGHEDAKIPGGVNKGFQFCVGRRGLATGYPTFPGVHDQPRDGLTPAGQEPWQVITAYFMLAAQQLQRAHAQFDK